MYENTSNIEYSGKMEYLFTQRWFFLMSKLLLFYIFCKWQSIACYDWCHFKYCLLIFQNTWALFKEYSGYSYMMCSSGRTVSHGLTVNWTISSAVSNWLMRHKGILGNWGRSGFTSWAATDAQLLCSIDLKRNLQYTPWPVVFLSVDDTYCSQGPRTTVRDFSNLF